MSGWLIITDRQLKELLKSWPGEIINEGLLGRYRLKLVSTFIMVEETFITFPRYPRALFGNG